MGGWGDGGRVQGGMGDRRYRKNGGAFLVYSSDEYLVWREIVSIETAQSIGIPYASTDK